MHKTIQHIRTHSKWASIILSGFVVAVTLSLAVISGFQTTEAANRSGLPWPSGVSSDGSNCTGDAFASWRGRPNDVEVVWPARQTWADMTDSYIYRDCKGKAPTMAIGLPPFPQNTARTTGYPACAAGSYDDEWRAIASNLKATGLDDGIIRLGWEFNGDWYNHTAYDPALFASCWRKIYNAAESVAPALRWDWTVNAGQGKAATANDGVLKAWPGNEYVDIVGIDSYDNFPPARDEAGWKAQTEGEYRLYYWLDFAKKNGKKFSVPEWGAHPRPNAGDWAQNNPYYVEKMFNFFKTNQNYIAYEAWFNHRYGAFYIYPTDANPAAAAKYQALYKAGAPTTPGPGPTPSPSPSPSPTPAPTPLPFGPGTYNDTQFTCTDGWREGDGAGMYQNDNRYHNAKDANCTVKFTGNQVKLYMTKNPHHGIVGVSIDNGPETAVDLYASSRAVQALVYTSAPTLTNATHTIKMRITGDKNAASSGTYIGLDRADISNNVQNVPVNPPTNLTANAASATTVNLSWTKPSGDITKYLVRRNGAVVAETTNTTYADTGLAANTQYSYTVVAVNSVGAVSSASNTATVKTPTPPDTDAPSAPTAVTATAVSPVQVNVSWNASTDNVGVAGYRIYRNGTQVGTTSATTTTFGNTGLTPNTSYNYTVIAFDGAGNLSSQSQPAATVRTPELTTNPSSNGLTGSYFPSLDFTGTPVVRTDSTVNFNWVNGSPATSIPSHPFTVRWSGGVKIPKTGEYTFYTNADDGTRLWVNDRLIVDDWTRHAAHERSGKIRLEGGKTYNIRLEYFEITGWASAQLLWSGPGIQKSIIPSTSLTTDHKGITATFYNNASLSGGSTTSRIDNQIDYNWGRNAPADKINTENWSARWTGKILADRAGEYTFYTRSDDGVRVWVNGKLIINNWTRHAETENSGKITLLANSRNDIKVEFNDVAEIATMKLQWSGPGVFKSTVPKEALRAR